MKKIAAAVLSVLALLTVLSACRPSSGDSPSAEIPSPTPVSPTAPVPTATVPLDRPQLIAHAGGAIYGYRLTNSLEALNSAYENGFRYIELDMELTSDGQVVLIHDWESIANRMLFSPGIRSLEEFLASETLADLTVLDLDMLLVWLEEHPDCTIITDVKNEDQLTVLNAIKDSAGDLNRFIPQAYSFEEYDTVKALGFDRVILTLYRMTTDPETIAAFAREKEPWAITMPEASISEDLLSAISGSGTAVYAHTINTLDFFEQWTDCGLTGIYTDYFIPAKWPY